jgi:hypothetical protein
MIGMLSRSEWNARYRYEADGSFVADTLRSVGRDMNSKDMDEDDVEEHVSCRLLSADNS